LHQVGLTNHFIFAYWMLFFSG